MEAPEDPFGRDRIDKSVRIDLLDNFGDTLYVGSCHY